MAGVYHLKNWEIVRDYMATMDEWILELALDSLGLSYDEQDLKWVARTCSKAISKEGLEICLTVHRDKLNKAFDRPGQLGEFEKFLMELDKVAEEFRKDFYEQHRL